MKTADFLICKRCGVYVAAVMRAGDKAYATLNLNALDDSGGITQEAVSVSYDAETEPQRRARREANWTPVAAIIESPV